MLLMIIKLIGFVAITTSVINMHGWARPRDLRVNLTLH